MLMDADQTKQLVQLLLNRHKVRGFGKLDYRGQDFATAYEAAKLRATFASNHKTCP